MIPNYLQDLFKHQQYDANNFFLIAGPCVVESEDLVMEIGEKVSTLDVTSDGPGNVLDISIMSSVISNPISSCGIRDSSVKPTVVDKFDIDKNEFVDPSKDNVDTVVTEGDDNVVVLIIGSDVDVGDDIDIVEVWN